MKIVIAEDQDMGRLILGSYLREWGHEVLEAKNGEEALELIKQDLDSIDMLITDWSMPIVDGVELAQIVRKLSEKHHYIYIILLTGKGESDDKLEGFTEGGVDDYIVKPFDGQELRLRVQVGNRLVTAERNQQRINQNLQEIVKQQTAIIQETQNEIVTRLFSALEFRDGETGDHVQRIGSMSASLAHCLGWNEEDINLIKAAAPLHDIGKIGIEDSVLRKPGKLTPEEFAIIQQHPTIGGDMLAGSHNAVIMMGEKIARNHHENWNGTGYPSKLIGEAIPIEARIVSIVDVYDALLSDRVYRPGLPEDKVISMLIEDKNKKFDPYLLDVFLEKLDWIKEETKRDLK